jgi:hypothetical protein
MLLFDVCSVKYMYLKCFWLCSPEHPSFRARGRSMLSGDRKSFREFADDVATSRFIPR